MLSSPQRANQKSRDGSRRVGYAYSNKHGAIPDLLHKEERYWKSFNEKYACLATLSILAMEEYHDQRPSN